ncbi:MAG: hypothetical protein ACI81W_001320 [Saprospiraceae bacterium]|jgi:hypothetical protein
MQLGIKKSYMKKIDHIIYAVPNLEQAIDQIEKQFGVRPIYGGKHPDQGTHNALLNLGNNCYLELLAIDPENNNILPPRWMGLDLIRQAKITRWAVKSNEIQEEIKVLKKINPLLAETKTGMRQRADGAILEWELSVPQAAPEIELLPFLIDWKDSEHPTAALPQHCQLLSFHATHPNPEDIISQLKSINAEISVEQKKEIALIVKIKTPNGQVVL